MQKWLQETAESGQLKSIGYPKITEIAEEHLGFNVSQSTVSVICSAIGLADHFKAHPSRNPSGKTAPQDGDETIRLSIKMMSATVDALEEMKKVLGDAATDRLDSFVSEAKSYRARLYKEFGCLF